MNQGACLDPDHADSEIFLLVSRIFVLERAGLYRVYSSYAIAMQGNLSRNDRKLSTYGPSPSYRGGIFVQFDRCDIIGLQPLFVVLKLDSLILLNSI